MEFLVGYCFNMKQMYNGIISSLNLGFQIQKNKTLKKDLWIKGKYKTI